MHVRIFQPRKSAMTSGRAKTQNWRLEMAGTEKRVADPLMGWTGIEGTQSQINLEFENREQAVAYAKRMGYTYQVEDAPKRTRLIKSYSENFAADRKQPWTH